MPRPRSSTFYLPLAPVDAPLSLKAKLSVLPPSAANALLAPRDTTTTIHPYNPNLSCVTPPAEDECTRLERVLGLTTPNTPVMRTRRHTDAPLPRSIVTTPIPIPLSNHAPAAPPTPALTDSSESDPDSEMDSEHDNQLTATINSSGSPSDLNVTTVEDRMDLELATTDMHMVTNPSSHTEGALSFVTTFDMDGFVDACETLHTSTSLGFPSPTHSPPSTAQPASPGLKNGSTALSLLPFGIATILACRSKFSSPLSYNYITPEEVTTSHCPPPKIIIHALSSTDGSKSLHPFDTRHLLPRELRLAYPPPPPQVLLQQSQAQCRAVVDPSIPGLVPECQMVEEDETAASLPSHQPLSQSQTQPQPPRQRFRLAPLYLQKVLRRSLGASAWARAESLACARLAEQRFGFAKFVGDPFEGLGGCLAGGGQPYLPSAAGGSCGGGGGDGMGSLVWSGYEDAFGLLSSFGINTGLTRPGINAASECTGGGWDLDLEDEEDAEFDEDLDIEDMETSQDMETEETEEMPFVREGAPEPEERPRVEPIRQDEISRQDERPESFSSRLSQVLPPRKTLPRLEDGLDRPSSGYTMVGRFTWDKGWSPVSPGEGSGWPTSTTSSTMPSTSTSTSHAGTFWDMEEDEKSPTPPTTPFHPGSSGRQHSSSYSSLMTSAPRLRREDGQEDEDEEEEIFRYSPLQLDQPQWHSMDEDPNDHCAGTTYLDTPSSSVSDSTLSRSDSTSSMPVSPSFPPAPIVGTKISSSYCSSSEEGSSETEEEEEEEFYDVEMVVDSPAIGASSTRAIPSEQSRHSTRIKVPRPLSLVQQHQYQQRYRPAYVDEDESTSPATGVFVIPPSPLTNATFPQSQSKDWSDGPTTPTASTTHFVPTAITAVTTAVDERPMDIDVGERFVSLKKSYERIGTRQSIDKIESRRSFERIEPIPTTTGRRSMEETVLAAPRPQRAGRALESMFGMESPRIRAGALPANNNSSAIVPNGIPSTSTSAVSNGKTPAAAAWTFGSLKSALSNSVSHLVELARSRSPSPLPWLMRGSSAAATTTATLAGVSAALTPSSSSSSSTTQSTPPRAEEDIEYERASCVTPTPTDRSRRSSTTTITELSVKRAVPQLNLHAVTMTADGAGSSSPPPKRTLSTSSLSSLSSEPDSESGSSGGMFSRSPSPEPSSDARIWDPSYSLTPRSRPISADAKASAACGGRLSPMMIPGSWDPEELWSDDVSVPTTTKW